MPYAISTCDHGSQTVKRSHSKARACPLYTHLGLPPISQLPTHLTPSLVKRVRTVVGRGSCSRRPCDRRPSRPNPILAIDRPASVVSVDRRRHGAFELGPHCCFSPLLVVIVSISVLLFLPSDKAYHTSNTATEGLRSNSVCVCIYIYIYRRRCKQYLEDCLFGSVLQYPDNDALVGLHVVRS